MPNDSAIEPKRTKDDLLIALYTLSKNEPLSKQAINNLTKTEGRASISQLSKDFEAPVKSLFWRQLDTKKKFVLAGLYCDLMNHQAGERLLAFTIRFPVGAAETVAKRTYLNRKIFNCLRPQLRENPELLLSWEVANDSAKGTYSGIHVHGTAILDLPQVPPSEHYDEIEHALESLRRPGWRVNTQDSYASLRWCAGYLLKSHFSNTPNPLESPTRTAIVEQ